MMHDYQTRAVKFTLDRPASYMAIDMGLGKTRIALEWIRQLPGPTIVFAPVRVCMTSWPDEIKKWGYDFEYAILHGTEKGKILKNIARFKLILCPYSSLKWLFSALTSPSSKGLKWTNLNVVFDESTFIKSHSTKRFEMLKKLKPLFTERRLALSATPAPNTLMDLWAQYYMLDGGECLGRNISGFRSAYCIARSYPGMPVTLYEVMESRVDDIYRAVAPITFRLEAGDYLAMPEVIYNYIPVQLPPAVMKQYKVMEKDMLLKLDEETVVSTTHAATLSMKLRQIIQGGLYTYDEMTNKRTGHHVLHDVKVQALKELVEESDGKPILCALQFHFELQMLREVFPKAPAIVGGCNMTESIRLVEEWNKGNIPLLFCHPQSLAHGVNLQEGGHLIVWYGLTWSLEQYMQLIGRLDRQGQKHPVIVHHLLASGTVDEAVKKALDAKETSQKNLLTYLKEYKHGQN